METGFSIHFGNKFDYINTAITISFRPHSFCSSLYIMFSPKVLSDLEEHYRPEEEEWPRAFTLSEDSCRCPEKSNLHSVKRV